MPDFKGDQAAGLRRLVYGPDAQIIRLVSGYRGVGKTSVALNVAAELSSRGARVLLVDENHGPANAGAYLGVRTDCALEGIVRQECTLEQALVPPVHGVTILFAADAALRLPTLGAAAKSRYAAILNSLRSRFDVVLLDASHDWEHGVELFSGISSNTIVISSTTKHAVMASYAAIKRLRVAGRQERFHVLLNKVEIDETAAVILRNLVDVALNYLHVPVAPLGSVPVDEGLRVTPGCQFLTASHPTSRSAERVRQIVDCILDWRRDCVPSETVGDFMRNVLAGSFPLITSSGVQDERLGYV